MDIDEASKFSLITRIYNGLALEYYGAFSDYILHEKGLSFFKTMKEFDPQLVEVINQKIRKLYLPFGIDATDVFHRHIVNILLMNWPNFMSQLLEPKVISKVLIVSDRGVGHAKMYQYRLRSELINFHIVDIYDRRELSVDWINENKYTYVISNCDLKGLDKNIKLMCVSTCPTSNDIALVRETFANDDNVVNLYKTPGKTCFI